MSASTLTDKPGSPRGRPRSIFRMINDLKIGPKLILAFGVLVALTLLGVGLNVLSHIRATQVITSTAEVRVPTELLAAQAQADLLKMQADVNGYLALGDQQYQDGYQQDSQAFAADLRQLVALGTRLAPTDRQALADLQSAYQDWSQYPARLFALRDDQLAREPAYRILATQGAQYGGIVLIDAGKLIDDQQLRAPSTQVMSQMADLARFQGSFSAMLSGLRGYVTTRNRIFRGEYEANHSLNQIAWQRLLTNAGNMDRAQQALVIDIQRNLMQFLPLPDQMFGLLEGPHWREDLYLFQTSALPASAKMLKALGDLTNHQQRQLILELGQGEAGLAQANRLLQVAGVLELLLAIAIGFVLHRSIAGPVHRLTNTAEKVGAGSLSLEARVESHDEIGILAETFNRMTAHLRDTLSQIRGEKQRADALLNVVIPLGVQLSGEKDFDHLLEQILVESKSFCRARSGALFLRTEDDQLQYFIVRDDRSQVAMGGTTGEALTLPSLPLHGPDNSHDPAGSNLAVRAAITGASINIANAIHARDFAYREQGDAADGGAEDETQVPYLAIPLKDSRDRVLGVLQLADCTDPETGQRASFGASLQQMMESFSSLAVAALEAYIREQGLRQQIQQLRLEIDEAKRQQQVQEIVESDFFRELQSKAQAMRSRHAQPSPDPGGRTPSEPVGDQR
jgi:HAMP domain-containing protein/CHASE3 domain sensor protein